MTNQLRVEVDPLLCEANGICEDLAPQMFKVNDQDELEVRSAVIPPELRRVVEDAVQRCPRQALSIEE